MNKAFSLSLLTMAVMCKKDDIEDYQYAYCRINGPLDQIAGLIKFRQQVSSKSSKQEEVRVEAKIAGLPTEKEEHAFAVMESSLDDGFKDCSSSGEHFNPFNVSHGFFKANEPARNRHVGGLKPLKTNREGIAKYEWSDPLIDLSDSSDSSILGKSVTIYAQPDDYGRQNSVDSLNDGSGGDRIACCNIVETDYSTWASLEFNSYLCLDDQEVVDGLCQCPAGQEQIRSLCLDPCRDDQERGEDDVCACPQTQDEFSGACVAECRADEERDAAGVCGCPEAQEELSGACVAVCRDDQERDGDGDCVCTGVEVEVSGSCVPPCRADQIRDDGGSCACSETQEEVSGQCLDVCPTGATRQAITNACECPDGQEVIEDTCVPKCAIGATRGADNVCACDAGQEVFEGTCVSECIPGAERNLDDGECFCPASKEILTNSAADICSNECVDRCPTGAVRNSDKTCQCPFGQEVVRGQCVPECPDDQTRDLNDMDEGTGECECKDDDKDFFDGSCVDPCDPTFVRNESTGVCECSSGNESVSVTVVGGFTFNFCTPICSANEVREENSVNCQCVTEKGFSVDADDSCTCPESKEVVGDQCLDKCAADEERDVSTSVCGCSVDKVKDDGICQPICGQNEERQSDGSCGCIDSFERTQSGCLEKCPSDEIRTQRGCGCSESQSKQDGVCQNICKDGSQYSSRACCKRQSDGGIKCCPVSVLDTCTP